jgi:hypothetical protein
MVQTWQFESTLLGAGSIQALIKQALISLNHCGNNCLQHADCNDFNYRS